MNRNEWTFPGRELNDAEADELTVQELVVELDVLIQVMTEARS